MNKGHKEEFIKRKIRMTYKLLKQCLSLLMNKYTSKHKNMIFPLLDWQGFLCVFLILKPSSQ